MSGNAHVAAIAANEAFNRARRSNASLDALLRKREDEARLSLDEAYTALKSKLRPQASWDLQMLDDAYQELDQHWAVLMLLPHGPYEAVLRDLVDSLEADAGAGRLSNEQQSLYDIARGLAEAFHGNARADEASWRRLERGLHRCAACRAAHRLRRRPHAELTSPRHSIHRPALPAGNAGQSLFSAIDADAVPPPPEPASAAGEH